MGIGGGSIGVAMNVAACQTENKFNVTIMSKCHGQFSLGTLTGALIATFLQKASLFYETQVIYISLIAALMGVIAMFCMPVFNQHSTSEKAFSFPPKALWGIGFLAFLALMAEGAMIDWSAIFMKDELQVTSGTMGTALIAFTLSMTIVRLFGDRLTGKFPTANLVKWAGLTTLVGMLIIITSTTITSALIGFFVVGIGIAILMPVIVRTASLHEGAQGINVASVSTVGYFGFLVGPPVIGFLSDAIELRYAFLLVAFIGLLVFVLAHPLRSALNNK